MLLYAWLIMIVLGIACLIAYRGRYIVFLNFKSLLFSHGFFGFMATTLLIFIFAPIFLLIAFINMVIELFTNKNNQNEQ